MAIIKPFKGIRPPQDLVEQVASRPYDCLLYTSLEPAIVMGLSVTVITAFANVVISLLRKTIPNRIRIIVQLVVVAACLLYTSECRYNGTRWYLLHVHNLYWWNIRCHKNSRLYFYKRRVKSQRGILQI